jgi:outer membrane immunogenic protein
MVSRVLVVGVALFGAVMGAAHAADQSVPRGPSSYYPNAYYPTSIDWTGFYVGLQGGGAFGSARWTNPFSGVADDPKPTSFVGGGQVGVNWTRDSFLLGVEADFTATQLDDNATDSLRFVHNVRTTWMSLVTARAGYAVNRYLAYVKGGAAFANERNTVMSPTPNLASPRTGNFADSGMTTQYGWTIGAGLEYAISPNWSAKVEYDFVDLPSQNMVLVGCTFPAGPIGVPPAPCTGLGSGPATVSYTIQKVIGGINYRF